MAYPTIASPYGMLPLNLIGGQVFAGSTRLMSIASNSATAIFYGDVVKLTSSGTIDRDVGTDAATPVGVFLGCTYSTPTFGKLFRQYYPGAVSATDIQAIVQDDPDVLFKVAVVSATTTISYANQTVVGNNAVLVQNTGSTVTGDSKIALSSTTATTSTWPIRIVDVVPGTELNGTPGSYTELIVKWNAGMHQYNNPTGV